MDSQKNFTFPQLAYTETKMFGSLWLYMKLLLFYPLKYTILFSILYFIIEILQYVMKYGKIGIERIMKFFKIILNPGQLNMIVFKIPNLFKIFMGLIDLFIGFIYISIATIFLIIASIFMIPFNIILPYYYAIRQD